VVKKKRFPAATWSSVWYMLSRSSPTPTIGSTSCSRRPAPSSAPM
jgi:hypothetical protein